MNGYNVFLYTVCVTIAVCKAPKIPNGNVSGLKLHEEKDDLISLYNVTCHDGYIVTNRNYDRLCSSPPTFITPPSCEGNLFVELFIDVCESICVWVVGSFCVYASYCALI